MASLLSRLKEPELMDDPSLDPAAHEQALRGLARINRFSASPRILWGPIAAWLRRAGRSRATLLDVATGAGDVPLALWRRARRAGVALEIAGCDASAHAVAHAQARARRDGADIRFFKLDALAEPLPPADIVTSSLFLHHLSDADALRLLRRIGEAAGSLALFNDLSRGRRGLTLAYVGTRLLSRSPVVHADGPQSVRAAFTMKEARVLAQGAGWTGATVRRRWPCRWLMEWRPC